jgi:lysozyme family protein
MEATMANFDSAIPVILQHEGGYVNHPNDPGGATNFGVSMRFLADYGNLGDFDGDGDVDIEDIRNMTEDQAKSVYKQMWWDKYNYGRIIDQTIATKVLDLSVNMGAKRAHILLQTALNNAFGLKLTVDGVLGPATFSVINSCTDDTEQTLLTAYCDEAFGFYQRLIDKNPKFKAFEKGWKRRAYSVGTANTIG